MLRVNFKVGQDGRARDVGYAAFSQAQHRGDVFCDGLEECSNASLLELVVIDQAIKSS